MPLWPSLRRTLRGRCPACGEGLIFTGLIQLKAACPHCGLAISKADIGDGPVFFVLSLLCVIGTPLALWAALATDWPMILLIPLWAVLLGLSAFFLLRPARAFFLAAQYEKRRERMTEET